MTHCTQATTSVNCDNIGVGKVGDVRGLFYTIFGLITRVLFLDILYMLWRQRKEGGVVLCHKIRLIIQGLGFFNELVHLHLFKFFVFQFHCVFGGFIGNFGFFYGLEDKLYFLHLFLYRDNIGVVGGLLEGPRFLNLKGFELILFLFLDLCFFVI